MFTRKDLRILRGRSKGREESRRDRLRTLTAGLDMGSKTTKVVVLSDGEVVARAIALSGVDHKGAARSAIERALAATGRKPSDIAKAVVTGAGRNDSPVEAHEVTEVIAAAKGVIFLLPSARTVIDVGAEEGRGVKTDATGKVLDFVISDRCAAGAGSFAEAMARALEVKIDGLGPLSMKSKKSITMNAQCAVFAESEVVSLVHARTPKRDIARAILDAIAGRVASMIRRLGVAKDVALVGGVARNVGFVDSLRRSLGVNVNVPPHPEFACALGAAIVAAALQRSI
ncbi:MAG: acyl-CoA dehydratase activase [Planctomycetota bacterium]|nr:acyl-CoA dehydratase activase [Planctomycetota bacterium]